MARSAFEFLLLVSFGVVVVVVVVVFGRIFDFYERVSLDGGGNTFLPTSSP